MDDSEARSILEAECAAAGERLLWWGRPAGWRSALRALPATFAGLPVAAFAAFWMWAAAGGLGGGARPGGPWLLFPLFGLPFLIFGLGMVLSPLFALGAAGRTLYAVTSGAILVVKAGRSRRVERHALPGEGVVRRIERGDGSGDLDVARSDVTTSRGLRTRKVTFVGIPDVARVERIVADAARSGRGGPAATPGFDSGARAPAQPAPHRTTSLLRDEGGRSEGAPRVLHAGVLLFLGGALGFALALALAREGRLPGTLGEVADAPSPASPELLPPARAPKEAAAPMHGAAPDAPSDPAPPPATAGRVSPLGARFSPTTPVCDEGDARECLRVAKAEIEGGGLERDPFLAEAAAGRGCDLGQAQACATLAWILSGRTGPTADDRLLVRAGERGCELGSGDACTQAGFALAYGRPGLPRDPARAEILLERACSDGFHPRACAALGDLLARRGARERARAVLSGCCAHGDGGCCTARDRLPGGG